jgi:hypothetical protein
MKQRLFLQMNRAPAYKVYKMSSTKVFLGLAGPYHMLVQETNQRAEYEDEKIGEVESGGRFGDHLSCDGKHSSFAI